MDDLLFRKAMGKFATGVTVLTTIHEGDIHGMTANAFMSVSLDPKLVVISVGKYARFLDKVTQSKRFAVNILAEDQQLVSQHFAGKPQGEVQFGTLDGLPVIDGAIAQITCEVASVYEEGDHTLFIGRVTDLKLEEKNPLLFFGGQYSEVKALEINKL
ncbi:flavin reductase (DIM6/NTAB) family NADH-FMN oxidoreductase RutF [Psychrobacillus insolitus]|uniref:Flavin reductase (DIM6/NTAB) family NADH-FMN oxidoreductase RutF n=1 Tax=Psychrobacillus insolitus TaxID=1461 RepID=A0A2W7MD01_9BACI|nr:flavin reductase family protein [Psychrobacillus insolitus]PZX02950.1 flavin reductase (DIM6/NTAB) family NADH-FMN oxidoreductase RutF [Psychrobacillus insolitus]